MLAPAFAAHAITAQQLLYVVGTLAGIALVTSIGVVGRRAAGGATMYRLQARYRRAVTRQYLRLPLSWHHRHPAGQLLSNANADVEADLAGRSRRCRWRSASVVMLVVAAVQMLRRPTWSSALVGLLVFPAGVRGQRRLPAPACRRW